MLLVSLCFAATGLVLGFRAPGSPLVGPLVHGLIAIVIDAPTFEALGTAGSDFEAHPATALRGLRRAEDVYSLAGERPQPRRVGAAGRP
jgi:hypothetical protein